MSKVLRTPEELARWVGAVPRVGGRIVFTNGCFDLIHPGHLDLLERCGAVGERVIVAINDDASVTRLKGPGRPIYPASERAEVLLSLRWVDAVVVFAEDTPMETIRCIRPDVLVKGSEYGSGQIVGEEFVLGYGGSVQRFPMKSGYATTRILEKIERTRQQDSRPE